jgi:transcriptional regulator with XRE-family HTH domain
VWIGPDDHSVVGSRLEAARRSAGITQQELARKRHKPQSFVSNYESGQRRVDVLELMMIAEALDCDPRLLFKEIALHWSRRKRRAR